MIEQLVEAQYQVELYRACYVLLDRYIYLTSECVPKEGQIDFQIKSMHWGIECVHDGDRLEGHMQRYHPGGRYYAWISSGQINEYTILDFRKTRPKKARGMVSYFQVLLEMWLLTA